MGPLYDIAQQTGDKLRTLLDSDANRAALFAAVLNAFTRDPAPTIVVIEDLHWADEATLDPVKFLARRLARARLLLLLTHRDDELGREHPLRLVLGDLPTSGVTRLCLPPLSAATVEVLARQQETGAAAQLHAVSGGNPFFVTELLTSDAPEVLTSVADAVLARMARRSPAARRLLGSVAVCRPESNGGWWRR